MEVKFLKRIMVVATFFQVATGCALPIVDFVLGYLGSGDPRTFFMPILYWSSSAVIGLLGLIGALSLRSWILTLYLVIGLGIMGSLPAFSASQYSLLVDRCDTLQAAYRGCGTCPCALRDTCTLDDLKSTLCKYVRFDRTDALPQQLFFLCIFSYQRSVW